jgi:oligopeptide transport system substrate-binding protein
MAGSGPDVDDASTFLKVFDGEGLYADTFMRWHNDEYAAILADSWATTDTEQRTEDLVAMEDFLLANGPVIPLYFTRAGWMLADGFTGISRNMTGADLDYIFGDKT